mmetsp:Transcript_18634/g.33351  ORF Transcript_18634/g.33351 Transcript_18634/m.33351 type:complete len:218 (+) Transcript_18634:1167-1820(+)
MLGSFLDVALGLLEDSHVERAEPVWIPSGEEVAFGDNEDGERTFQHRQSFQDLLGLSFLLRPGDEVKDEFRIRCRVEQSSGFDELFLDLAEVGDVSVVRETDVPVLVFDKERLYVVRGFIGSRSRVSGVADGAASLESGQNFLGEDVRDEAKVFVEVRRGAGGCVALTESLHSAWVKGGEVRVGVPAPAKVPVSIFADFFALPLFAGSRYCIMDFHA